LILLPLDVFLSCYELLGDDLMVNFMAKCGRKYKTRQDAQNSDFRRKTTPNSNIRILNQIKNPEL
jgi:hypothetical protein